MGSYTFNSSFFIHLVIFRLTFWFICISVWDILPFPKLQRIKSDLWWVGTPGGCGVFPRPKKENWLKMNWYRQAYLMLYQCRLINLNGKHLMIHSNISSYMLLVYTKFTVYSNCNKLFRVQQSVLHLLAKVNNARMEVHCRTI